jgi:hypothetical protein
MALCRGDVRASPICPPCGLDENEVAAISGHEHIPEIAAARIGELFSDAPHGGETI